jgi:hypothetical protein
MASRKGYHRIFGHGIGTSNLCTNLARWRVLVMPKRQAQVSHQQLVDACVSSSPLGVQSTDGAPQNEIVPSNWEKVRFSHRPIPLSISTHLTCCPSSTRRRMRSRSVHVWLEWHKHCFMKYALAWAFPPLGAASLGGLFVCFRLRRGTRSRSQHRLAMPKQPNGTPGKKRNGARCRSRRYADASSAGGTWQPKRR